MAAIDIKINYGTTESDGNGGEILTAYSVVYTTQPYNDGTVQPAPDSIDNDEAHKQIRSNVLSRLSNGQSIRYIAYVLDSSK